MNLLCLELNLLCELRWQELIRFKHWVHEKFQSIAVASECWVKVSSTCCNRIWWIFSACGRVYFLGQGERSSWDLSTKSMKHFDQSLSPQNAGSSSLNLLKQNLMNLLCLKLKWLCELRWEKLMRYDPWVHEAYRPIAVASECWVEVPQLAETVCGESSLLEVAFTFWAEVREADEIWALSLWSISSNRSHLRILSQSPSTCWNSMWWIFSAWSCVYFLGWGERSSWDLSS